MRTVKGWVEIIDGRPVKYWTGSFYSIQFAPRKKQIELSRYVSKAVPCTLTITITNPRSRKAKE
jgi:hypothetical protein